MAINSDQIPYAGGTLMFQQLLTPIGDSLGLSFLVAILPIVAVLVLLGLLRRPAWQAALAGLVTGLITAVIGWKMPVGLAINSRSQRRNFRALARDVDRDQRAADLQHSRTLRSVRCIPKLGRWPSAQRPPRHSGRGWLLFRRIVGRRLRVWNTSRHHQFAPDPRGLSTT